MSDDLKTIVDKISISRNSANILFFFVILALLCLMILFFCAIQYGVCQSKNPDVTITECFQGHAAVSKVP